MNSVVLKELRKFQCFKKHRKTRANNIRKSKFFDGRHFAKKRKKNGKKYINTATLSLHRSYGGETYLEVTSYTNRR